MRGFHPGTHRKGARDLRTTQGYPGRVTQKRRHLEKFEHEFIQIVRNKLADPDPVYVEELEKLRRAMLLVKKGHPGQALSMFLASKRRRYPEAYEAFEQEMG